MSVLHSNKQVRFHMEHAVGKGSPWDGHRKNKSASGCSRELQKEDHADFPETKSAELLYIQGMFK